ncbi:MAG: UDP-3-O-(3-hydroxymyristoyl)glucosamine N-acyltransferase [Rhodospirillaceae bacterium]
MPDSRFFQRTGPFRAREIADWVGATCFKDGNLDRLVEDISDLGEAGPGHLSYLSGADYIDQAATSSCGVCLTTETLAECAPPSAVILLVTDPQSAFATAADKFYAPKPAPLTKCKPSESGAMIDDSAQLGVDVILDVGCVVGANVHIGARTRIGPGATIGAGVVIGENCDIGANVSLMCCLISDDVIIHPGARIGQDGFGFVFDSTAQRHRKIPQLGRAIIKEDVEIGANTTIDRGALGDTIIGSGCRIDNQVQIAHNVVLGARCIVVSQVGISGSCQIGDDVVLAGQVGLADHVKVGSKAQVAAKSGVMRDIEQEQVVMGYPAKPIREFWRDVAAIGRLSKRKKSL